MIPEKRDLMRMLWLAIKSAGSAPGKVTIDRSVIQDYPGDADMRLITSHDIEGNMVIEASSAAPVSPPTHWWDMPSELEHRTIALCGPMLNDVLVTARGAGNVTVHDTVTDLGFAVTREEFIDGVYLTVIPERWAELMRQRIADGTVAADKPTM